MRPYYERDGVTLYLGDCREVLPTLETGSADLILTDPPYPEIDRDYGRLTEPEWHGLMREVVGESRRIVKATGSAVYILQPNSERVGRMRTWLWEFLAWAGREWNIVQDAYWWNYTALPVGGISRTQGLMRPSLKYCVWLGGLDCFRDQSMVLWQQSEANLAHRLMGRALHRGPSGRTIRYSDFTDTAEARGGTTPFNVLPISNSHKRHDHPASTPEALVDWWARYASPPGGYIVDPFVGSGTTLEVAARQGRQAIGIERMEKYAEIAARRLEALTLPLVGV